MFMKIAFNNYIRRIHDVLKWQTLSIDAPLISDSWLLDMLSGWKLCRSIIVLETNCKNTNGLRFNTMFLIFLFVAKKKMSSPTSFMLSVPSQGGRSMMSLKVKIFFLSSIIKMKLPAHWCGNSIFGPLNSFFWFFDWRAIFNICSNIGVSVRIGRTTPDKLSRCVIFQYSKHIHKTFPVFGSFFHLQYLETLSGWIPERILAFCISKFFFFPLFLQDNRRTFKMQRGFVQKTLEVQELKFLKKKKCLWNSSEREREPKRQRR